MLLSAFTAKPWRQGFTSLITFIFRAKAAAAYATSHSIMAMVSSAPPARAAARAKPPQPEVQGSFDSRRVADGDRKTSMYGDDSELCAGAGDGAVVVSVAAAARIQGGGQPASQQQ